MPYSFKVVALGATLIFGPMVVSAHSAEMKMQPAVMDMHMSDKPAQFAPTRSAYTRNHEFLVKLLVVPHPIPFEKYFNVRFAVYDGHHPSKEFHDAHLALFAGMRHGLKHGFAHGMQSSPKIRERHGVFRISGMYFHMMGPWVVKVTVKKGKETGVAYFRLPCCGT